jgi:hypothetical protein
MGSLSAKNATKKFSRLGTFKQPILGYPAFGSGVGIFNGVSLISFFLAHSEGEYLNEEITPLLPTIIGERYSQTIKI